jgi:AAA15 family ATPase/GTPase
MFIKSIKIENYKVFHEQFELKAEHIAIPDGTSPGSGLTVLVGENGIGKTSILEAISLPLMSYKAESLTIGDFGNIQNSVEVTLNADKPFSVKKAMSGVFDSIGFKFVAKLRSQNSLRYLVDTVVTDSYFVPNTNVTIQANSPDLRVAVANPFAGPRFSENDYLFIDKNRVKALETGTYSTTKFDRVLEDLNFQYLKINDNEPLELNNIVEEAISHVAIDSALAPVFEEFKDITGYEVKINFIDNALPYKKAFLGYSDLEHEQIPVEKMGSGYQMFLALLCQERLSLQSGKKLIVLIDEVELHLHPKLQKKLVDILLNLSATAQVIITSHSPELLKDLQVNSKRKINVILREENSIIVNPIDKFLLPLPTISETNYVAFNLASMEYFIELYNQIGETNGVSSIAAIDRLLRDGSTALIDWDRDDGPTQQLTKYSCIRNKFHHPSNSLNDSKFSFDYEAVSEAIVFLRSKLV